MNTNNIIQKSTNTNEQVCILKKSISRFYQMIIHVISSSFSHLLYFNPYFTPLFYLLIVYFTNLFYSLILTIIIIGPWETQENLFGHIRFTGADISGNPDSKLMRQKLEISQWLPLIPLFWCLSTVVFTPKNWSRNTSTSTRQDTRLQN